MASVQLSAEFSRLVATTRKAIAEHDEATLRDCVERLIALRAFAAMR